LIFMIVEPLGNKYVLLQLMCLDLCGFLYRLMFFSVNWWFFSHQ
jgi:hypothetical protein